MEALGHLEHIVFLSLEETQLSQTSSHAPELTKKEHLFNMFYAIRPAMEKDVPGNPILDMSIGKNVTPARAPDGYNYALRVRFKSPKDLPRYATHPSHVAFVECVKSCGTTDCNGNRRTPLAMDWLV